MKIKNIQKLVHNWIEHHGIRYFDVLTNTILLSEEVGEVSRIIARNYGEQSKKKNCKKIEDLGEELSDVLFVLICLANQTGINLEKSFNKKLKKKETRDHERHHENEKLK
ncbi:MAG: nucleotide pyrophosphohydrolase [Flavobacteriales bacterium]|uniref:nucleotide pyrophosphohydrolase n=1 Tax=Blattabacterium sp. (Mastotermes darwiniensis) TaxID=39768 RepID=UPI000231DFAE|nr:nucleotide pyrophosphohydrolase [Blattabacterium sp. (Mastotermes darwiniensis)]AER40454.1 nucleoside-triphosphate diphosphatase [Blattabacterium sp. (Mastotermes darwiniensis) str. MADAR]MDR1805030.1 nucleotide pyrophosphohydrolase [Flavobacteriales bacterium]